MMAVNGVPSKEREVSCRVLSLGAGVQSTVLALMMSGSRVPGKFSEHGYRKPDFAIFADTGWEPGEVYKHLGWLEGELGFPVHRVSAGNIQENLKKGVTPSGHSFVDVPFYLANMDGSKGVVMRQCTSHYKLEPIRSFVRRKSGVGYKERFPRDQKVEMWIGISTDEAMRMKPSREAWVEHRWPLVDAGISRDDCMKWFNKRYPGRVLPKSACVMCPYRSTKAWAEMRENSPEDYKGAVAFDRYLRHTGKKIPVRKILNGMPYVHNSRRPLDQVVMDFIRKGEDAALPDSDQFGEECEGMCGV